MALPKINLPTFDIVVPSTNKTIKCRPYLVGENVILLAAMESDNIKEMTEAIKRIINNCVVDWKGQNIDNLAIFDLEYIFLKIRAKAKGEKIQVKFNPIEETECPDCAKPKLVNIDIDKLQIKRDPTHTNKIQLTEEYTLEMCYPKYEILSILLNKDPGKFSEVSALMELVKNSMVNIYDKDTVYEMKESSDQEKEKFLESLTEEQFNKILTFFETMPKIEYVVDLSCKTCGRRDVQTINGLQSFFV